MSVVNASLTPEGVAKTFTGISAVHCEPNLAEERRRLAERAEEREQRVEASDREALELVCGHPGAQLLDDPSLVSRVEAAVTDGDRAKEELKACLESAAACEERLASLRCGDNQRDGDRVSGKKSSKEEFRRRRK